MQSCSIPQFKNDNKTFIELRKETYNNAYNILGKSQNDVLEDIALSLNIPNIANLTMKNFIEYNKSLKELKKGSVELSIDKVLENLEESKLILAKQKTLNPTKLDIINEQISKYKALKEKNVDTVYVSKDNNTKSIDFEKNAVALFTDISLINTPLFYVKNSKKLKVDNKTFDKFKSFVSNKARNAYLYSYTMGQNVYSIAEAFVADLQILKNDMNEQTIQYSKKLSEISNDIENYWKTEITNGNDISQEDLKQIDEIAYKAIENGKYNTNTTKVWFEGTPKGNFNLFSFFNEKGVFTDIGFTKENSVFLTENELKDLQQKTKSLVAITDFFTNKQKFYFDRNILLQETLDNFKATTKGFENVSDAVLKTSFLSAYLHRSYFQKEGLKLLKINKKNYQYLYDLYKAKGDVQKANKIKLEMDKIGSVGHTYVPRTYNLSYFNSEVLSKILPIIKNINPNNLEDTNKAVKSLSNVSNLNEKELLKFVLENKNNSEMLQAILETNSKNFETDLDLEDFLNGFKLNNKQKSSIIMVHRKMKEDNDVMLWKNLEHRVETPELYIPVQPNITQASSNYTNAGIKKIFIDRMKYQYSMHKEYADRNVFLDKIKGVDYSENHLKTWDFLKKHLDNVTGETYITDVKFFNMLDKNPNLNKFFKLLTTGTTKEPLNKNDVAKVINLVNKLSHAHFLGYNISAPIRNYIGSRKQLITNSGFRALGFTKGTFPKQITQKGTTYDIAKLAEDAGVVAYVDYINEINDRINSISDETEREKIKIVFDESLASNSVESLAKLVGYIPKIINTYADLGKYLFEYSEKQARLKAFTLHVNYGVQELHLDVQDAVKYAQGAISLTDGIYDASGKVLISNGMIASIFYKYMNYGVTKINFLKNIIDKMDIAEETKMFLYSKDDNPNVSNESRIKMFTEFLDSDLPTAKLLRFLLVDTMVGAMQLSLRVFAAKMFIDVTTYFGDEFLQAILNIYDALTNDEDEVEDRINVGKQGARKIPVGLVPGMAISLISAGLEQEAFGDRDIVKNENSLSDTYLFRSENRFYSALQATLRPNVLDFADTETLSKNPYKYVTDRIGLYTKIKDDREQEFDESVKENIGLED